MSRIICILLAWLLLGPGVLYAACTGSGTSWTSTPDNSSIDTCVSNANSNPGSTLTITAGDGSENWSTTKTFTRGVTIVGPGRSSLTITSSATYVIAFIPNATSRDIDSGSGERFELSGITFDGAGLYVEGGSGSLNNKVSIHDLTIKNAGMGFTAENNIVGVVYNCIFTNCDYAAGTYGEDYYSWAESSISQSVGTRDSWYFEDNTLNWTAGSSTENRTTTGQGNPGMVWRYNNYDYTNHSTGASPPHDNHGLQLMSNTTPNCTSGDGTQYPDVRCSQQYSAIKMEVYGNLYNMRNATYQWIGHRGSVLMMFNNRLGADGDIEIGEYSCDSSQAITKNVAPPQDFVQHIKDTYVWNNFGSGSTRKDMFVDSDGCWDNRARATYPYQITENVDFWNYNPNALNGSTQKGINVGSATPSGSCAVGDGYWKTSYSPAATPPTTLADMKTYTQAGTFYRCTAPNTWTAYYTPYTYPHPLRSGATTRRATGGGTIAGSIH